MKPDTNEGGLNPEPTQAQWASYLRHKARGTSPGNPKWYKNPVIGRRAVFVPGLPPKYPHIETGAEWKRKNRLRGPDPFKAAAGKDGGAYIRAYREALRLAK